MSYPQKIMIHCQPHHEMSLCTQPAMAYTIYYTTLKAYIYIEKEAIRSPFEYSTMSPLELGDDIDLRIIIYNWERCPCCN